MIAVSPEHPSIPVLYQETDTKFGIAIEAQFVDFLPIQPPKPIFDIPIQCGRKSISKAPTRKVPFIF